VILLFEITTSVLEAVKVHTLCQIKRLAWNYIPTRNVNRSLLIQGQAASTFTFIRSSRFISLFKHMRFKFVA